MSTIGPNLPESAKAAEFLGTPLTGRSRSVANNEDPLKVVAGRYKQEVKSGLVTDGRGGQRFHGAFHGGFSAGYFNTVGSIHGFTPSSFKSSRKSGRSTVQQKPEDFMDEEDLDEHMQLGVNVKNQSLFSTTADELAARSSEIAPGLVTSAPIVRSIGIILMQRMGWSRGDPIGKSRIQIRHYTVEPDPTVQQARSAPKADVLGLGYVPSSDEQLRRLPTVDDDDGSFTEKYDTSISFGDEDEVTVAHKPKSTKVKERFPGYILSTVDVSIVSPPPIQGLRIPKNWKPSACPVTEAEIAPELERFRSDIELVAKRRRRPLSLDERSAALGEEVHPAALSTQQTSIFSMISSEAKAQLSKSLTNMFHVGSTLAVGNTDDITVHFPDDPAKQARFVQFLKTKAIGGDPTSEPTRDWRSALELQQFETLASTIPAPAVKQEPKTESRPEIPTDYDSAAKLKMFGSLTRETMDWVPPRLLCKRFHVPDPYQGRAIPTPTIQKRTRYEDLLATVHPELVALQNPVTPPVSVKQENANEEDTPEKEDRPPVDLFKAIFAESDDDAEENELPEQISRRGNPDKPDSKRPRIGC